MKAIIFSTIFILATISAFASEVVSQKSDESDFLPLFDGESLEGWTTADPSWWTIEDGAITGTITEDKPCSKNQYLFSDIGVMGDFELKLSHRIESDSNINCGFQFRSEHYGDADCKGYQIDNNLPEMIRIYDEFGRHTLAHRGERTVFDEDGERTVTSIEEAKDVLTAPSVRNGSESLLASKGEPWYDLKEWHEYHLICRGATITLYVDGRLLAEVIDNDPNERDLSGLLAMQLHSGPPMKVQFRDIRWKPLESASVPTVPAEPSATDKTLVAWASLDNFEQRGGSVLTIQCEDQFDGIVFGEIESSKWMAGSNVYDRTDRNQSARSLEAAGPDELVQIAVVYRDLQIEIYRNGELYAAHSADNIDLLSQEYNFAVFGIRHVGATNRGHIEGSIEDARIYNRALSVEEIRSLEPDEPSEIEPYAWWDFETDEASDRTGRFAHTRTDGEATLLDGRLVLGEGGVLVAAQTEEHANAAVRGRIPGPPYMPETPEMPDDVPETWLTYHLAHPGPGVGMPGDPNCAFFYKGRYHLHYIYRNKHGYAFAHVSSVDMVKWDWHPTVLVGSNTGHGMFSGTGFFTKDGTPAIIYHGQGSGRNYIAYAQDDNMDVWSDPIAIEPKTETGEDAEMRHWDPDCWLNGDTYFGISGGGPPHLIKSSDLENWSPLGLLLHEETPDLGVDVNEDISCANMFKIGDRWMLLCISHGLGCRYYLGDFQDEFLTPKQRDTVVRPSDSAQPVPGGVGIKKYLPDFHAMMNWKDWNFFAPESLLTEDGRRVMWAWCRLENGGTQTAIQSLPRELSLPEDGVLRIRPLRELESLRYEEEVFEDIAIADGEEFTLPNVSGDAIELNVQFEPTDASSYGVRVFCDEQGEGFDISYDSEEDVIKMGDIAPPFQLEVGEGLNLRIFLDKNMVEVFVNNRQAAVYMVPHDLMNDGVNLFSEGGDSSATVKSWKMESIY
jgi:beta-fructofuranosidase